MIKKLFIFVLILVGMSATAQEILPSVQQTPFGDVELISCTTDLRVNGPLYLGVRALPKEEWQLDVPDLKITTSEPLPTALFTPFKQPYPQAPLYPISAVLTYRPTQPITFNVEGSWRACKDDQCVTAPIHLSTTLGMALALLTPECSPITLALSNTPVPMYSNNIAAYAQLDDRDNTKVVLDFERPPRTLIVYGPNKEPLDLDIQIENKRATFVLPQTQNANRFIVRTYYHYYEIEPKVIPQDMPIPDVPLSTLQILQACLLFFLLSGAPIYWARVPLSSRQKFRAQTKQMLILTTVLGIIVLCGALFYAYQNDLSQINKLWPFLIQPISKTWTIILMILGVLFIPASPLLTFLFLAITPRPYLTFLGTSSNILLKLAPCFSFVILTLLAFAIQLLFQEKIFKLLDGNKAPKIWWVARLPWLALIIYTLCYL